MILRCIVVLLVLSVIQVTRSDHRRLDSLIIDEEIGRFNSKEGKEDSVYLIDNQFASHESTTVNALEQVESIQTIMPTEEPTESPSEAPTHFPTISPSLFDPTSHPTSHPTSRSLIPTKQPTLVPSPIPSDTPSQTPTHISTSVPSVSPTITATSFAPTSSVPTVPPTYSPSVTPSLSPRPSVSPTTIPTFTPTIAPSSVAPTTAPTLQNRPIIRVECNITLYNITTPTLSADALATINQATAWLLRVPLDRISTVRYELVTSSNGRRLSERVAENYIMVENDASIVQPETLWDVQADTTIITTPKQEQNNSDTNSEVAGKKETFEDEAGIIYDSNVDPTIRRNVTSNLSNDEETSSILSQDIQVTDVEMSDTKRYLRDRGEPRKLSPSSVLYNIIHPLVHYVAHGRNIDTSSAMFSSPNSQSIYAYLTRRMSNIQLFSVSQYSSAVTTEAAIVTYQLMITTQVEVMMVDFPEYRSFTNGTRLMNFLRQRIRGHLRTGNYSTNLRRVWREKGYTSGPTAMAGAQVARIILRNQGLVYAPSFAPTPAPIAVTENASVATTIAGFIVGAVFGCLLIGGIVVIMAARHAEHQLPPKAVEFKSLSTAEEGKEATLATSTKDGKMSKSKASAKSGKRSDKVAVNDAPEEEDAALPSALKKKPQP